MRIVTSAAQSLQIKAHNASQDPSFLLITDILIPMKTVDVQHLTRWNLVTTEEVGAEAKSARSSG